MKNFFFQLPLLILILIGFNSCKEETSPTPQKNPEELAIIDLTGGNSQIWIVADGGSVVRDGRSETNIYRNFELNLAFSQNSRTYTTFNSNDLFDASGNWSFAGSNFDKITLSGTKPASGREISFTRTGNDLILTFTIAVPGSRTIPNGAVAGNYIFTLKKK
jgi:hypothetical protein